MADDARVTLLHTEEWARRNLLTSVQISQYYYLLRGRLQVDPMPGMALILGPWTGDAVSTVLNLERQLTKSPSRNWCCGRLHVRLVCGLCSRLQRRDGGARSLWPLGFTRPHHQRVGFAERARAVAKGLGLEKPTLQARVVKDMAAWQLHDRVAGMVVIKANAAFRLGARVHRGIRVRRGRRALARVRRTTRVRRRRRACPRLRLAATRLQNSDKRGQPARLVAESRVHRRGGRTSSEVHTTVVALPDPRRDADHGEGDHGEDDADRLLHGVGLLNGRLAAPGHLAVSRRGATCVSAKFQSDLNMSVLFLS